MNNLMLNLFFITIEFSKKSDNYSELIFLFPSKYPNANQEKRI